MAPWVIDISFLYVSIKLYINLLKHLKVGVQENCEFSYRSNRYIIHSYSSYLIQLENMLQYELEITTQNIWVTEKNIGSNWLIVKIISYGKVPKLLNSHTSTKLCLKIWFKKINRKIKIAPKWEAKYKISGTNTHH